MLRGLNSKFRHAVPVITSKNPPRTFLSTRSYLLPEEQYYREHAKATQHQALLTIGGSRSDGSSSGAPAGDGGSGTSSNTSAPRPPPAGYGASNRPDSNRNFKKKGGRGRGSGTGGPSSNASRPQQTG